MAKKRKTREQKQLADLRHTLVHSRTVVSSSTTELKPKFSTKFEAKTTTTTLNTYPYLKKDLSKTALITITVLIFQALLFIALKNHIFAIPGLNY